MRVGGRAREDRTVGGVGLGAEDHGAEGEEEDAPDDPEEAQVPAHAQHHPHELRLCWGGGSTGAAEIR